MPPRQQRTTQRGDFTGQETERLQRENAEAIAKRQQEIGTINQIDVVIEQEGIFDPVSGELVEMSPEAQARIEELENTVTYVDNDEVFEVGQDQGPPPPQATQPVLPQQAPKQERPNPLEVQDVSEGVTIVEQEYKVIRVNSDVEGLTYGMGNTMDFFRGRRYRVPIDLYRWLESRGLVYH